MKNFPFQLKKLRAETRRQFFGQTGLGLGAMALSALLDRDVFAAKQAWSIPSKVKSVIYLHMAGSPSQLELFDHKPALGNCMTRSAPRNSRQAICLHQRFPKMLGPQSKFQQHGETADDQ